MIKMLMSKHNFYLTDTGFTMKNKDMSSTEPKLAISISLK